MLVATIESVVAAGDGIGEAAGRRQDEAAVVNRPAEALVEVQLRPALVVIDLAAGSEQRGTALDAVEVGQGEVGAGFEETVGGEGGAAQGERDGDNDRRSLHLDDKIFPRECWRFSLFCAERVYWNGKG